MIKPLLIEVLVEELPAIPFLKELPNIEAKWSKILEENSLLCEFNFYYTPRRLVLWHREFKTAQDDTQKEFWGAPLNIAYKDGKPTGAVNGFAKKCGISIDEIKTNTKNGQEFLYYQSTVKGKKSSDILDTMVNQFIKDLNFGKSMRWSDRKDSFIRPIRGVSVVLGDELVDVELYGMKSSKKTFGHRMVSYEPFEFDFAGEYFCKLDKNGVVLYPNERKNIIINQIKQLEKQHNITVEVDSELLDEIVAITEYPTALLGSFDEKFLALPKEVIIGSMKEHQRYFAVYKDGEITNKFIVVSNSYTKDFSYIVAGNEKVLRPRLSDAMFFWENDIKNRLANDGLKDISFVDGLGSMYDKSIREANIAKLLVEHLSLGYDKELIEETLMLSKADLLTDMVYEFTELQGTMGYYYAKILGKDEQLCLALKEQYLPNKEDGELPSTKFSAIVALANKLDNLLGLFSVGMIPTGTRDPFALRRAVVGIFKIVKEHQLTLDIDFILDSTKELYPNLNKNTLLEFFYERIYKLYKDINPSIIKAVLNSTKYKDLYNTTLKIEALNSIVNSSDFRSFSDTFKRVANIVKDIDFTQTINVDETLLKESQEVELYKQFSSTISRSYSSYDEHLDSLFALKPYLDNFFDNVFVNDKDIKIKTNRKNLIAIVYSEFKSIADIKEITI